MVYENRIFRVQSAMKEQGMDMLLLTPGTDLFYLTGMRGHMYERLVCALITCDKVHFISPAFEIGNLKKETLQLFNCHGWTDGENPFLLVDKLFPNNSCRVAVGTGVPSWVLLAVQNLRPNYLWTSAEELMRELRIKKDNEEYRLLKQVQERSCRALNRVLEHGVCGMTERQVGKLIMEYSEREEVDSPGGIPIVAVGPNSALPHHQTGDSVIKAGDILLIDFGGENIEGGYMSDTTRTFAVKHIPDGFLEIYNIVKRANQTAFEAVKPGVPCRDIDKAARDVISAAGYGSYFTHRVGHGLGLDVHEHPYMSLDNERLIEAGNVFSIEPGIYLPGQFGVRIEDIVFVKGDGAERLTPLDHELHIID